MNGIRSSPAARIVARRTCGSFDGDAWCATRSSRIDSSIIPCDAVTSRSRARSSAAERAEVRVRQDPAFQRPFARPHDVGDEVLEAELGELGPDPGVMVGLLAGEDEQLLHVATRCTIEEIDDLVRLVQMRAMGGERAVLAMRAAGPRQRQGDVAGEGDATTHR